MSDTLQGLLTQTTSLSATLRSLVQAAYDEGYRDGGLAMRDHILQAANAPVTLRAADSASGSLAAFALEAASSSLAASAATSAATSAAASATGAAASQADNWRRYTFQRHALAPASVPTQAPQSPRVASRAPRGLVRAAVAEALADAPGLSISDIEDRVVATHPEVARKSVGNQLRGFEGDLYRREGKYKWFLIEEPEPNPAGKSSDNPAGLHQLFQEGGEAK